MKLFLILILFIPTLKAQLYLDTLLQAGAANVKELNQIESASSTLAHDGWTMHGGISSRLGLKLWYLALGGVGDFSLLQYEGEKQDANPTSSFDGDEDYDNVMARTMWGGFLRINPGNGPAFLIGEYYTKVSNKVTYAETVPENIWGKGDRLYGTGWGLGAGYFVSNFQYQILLRNIIYDEFKISGMTSTLPNATYNDKLNTWEITLQFGFAFDWAGLIKLI